MDVYVTHPERDKGEGCVHVCVGGQFQQRVGLGSVMIERPVTVSWRSLQKNRHTGLKQEVWAGHTDLGVEILVIDTAVHGEGTGRTKDQGWNCVKTSRLEDERMRLKLQGDASL